jgi:hypothetical protein
LEEFNFQYILACVSLGDGDKVLFFTNKSLPRKSAKEFQLIRLCTRLNDSFFPLPIKIRPRRSINRCLKYKLELSEDLLLSFSYQNLMSLLDEANPLLRLLKIILIFGLVRF